MMRIKKNKLGKISIQDTNHAMYNENEWKNMLIKSGCYAYF